MITSNYYLLQSKYIKSLKLKKATLINPFKQAVGPGVLQTFSTSINKIK